MRISTLAALLAFAPWLLLLSSARARAAGSASSAQMIAVQPIGTPIIGAPITFGPEHLPLVSDREDPLVDASQVIPGLVVDLRYATANNFTGHPLYPPGARCLLRKSIAERLVAVAQHFAARRERLVAWDCSRPPSAQVALFRAHPHPGSVADPKRGSLHERGVAIDLALADETGKLLPLPTGFDAFGPRAAADAKLPEGPAKENRDALIAAMNAAGFRPNPREWWHFSRLWGFRWPEVREEQLWPPAVNHDSRN